MAILTRIFQPWLIPEAKQGWAWLVHGWEIEGKITSTLALFLEEIKLSFKGNSQRTSFCKSCPILLCVVSRLLESKAGLKKGMPRTWETWLEVSGVGRLTKELNLDKTTLVSKVRNVTLAGPGQRNHCLWLVLSVPLYFSMVEWQSCWENHGPARPTKGLSWPHRRVWEMELHGSMVPFPWLGSCFSRRFSLPESTSAQQLPSPCTVNVWPPPLFINQLQKEVIFIQEAWRMLFCAHTCLGMGQLLSWYILRE